MIQIITDSISDFLQSEAKKTGIQVLPLTILMDEESYIDGVTITNKEFYEKITTVKQLPKTSQITPNTFLDAITPHLDKGDEVLIITGSSKLSGTHQSAVLAQEMCSHPSKVHIIDSYTASLGQSALVHQAISLRDQGSSIEEIISILETIKSKQKLFGHVSDLKYLVMGGRLSSFTGKAGNILKIRPVLHLSDGELGMNGLVRGKKKMLDWFVEQLKKSPPDLNYPVYFASSNVKGELLELKNYVENHCGLFPQITLMDIGPVVGAHVGPGTIAISWISK